MKRTRRAVTSAERKQMLVLYRQGVSKKQIAKEVKRSYSVVMRHLQIAEAQFPKLKPAYPVSKASVEPASEPVVPQYTEVLPEPPPVVLPEPPPVVRPRTIMQKVRDWFAGK